MAQQRHIIKQQILDLQVQSKIPTFELQNQLSSLYRSKIIPLIEAYCNQISTPDTLLRIDTLHIDLGEIDRQTLETDFIEKVKEQLTQQLAQQLAQQLSRYPASTPAAPTPAVHRASIPPNARMQQAKPPPPTNPTTAQLELLSYFLQTGLLPWWCNSLSSVALEDCYEQLRRTSPVALKALLQAQLKQAKPLQRLIYQFTDKTLVNIVDLMVPGGFTWIQPYCRDLQTLRSQVNHLREIPPRQFRLKLWQEIFGTLSLSPNTGINANVAIRNHLLQLAISFHINVPTFFQQLRQGMERLRDDDVRLESELPAVLEAHLQTAVPPIITHAAIENLYNLLNKLKSLNNKSSISSSLQEKLDALLDQFNDLRSAPSDTPSTNSLTDITTLVTELETQASFTYRPLINQIKSFLQSISPQPLSAKTFAPSVPSASSHPSVPFNDPITPFSDSEELYIQNAGLILLWPFLTRLFETLNLVQSNQFIDPQAAERAVLLLQYLADDSTANPEHLLPLNKLLCGLDLLDPIAAHLDMTELEQTECNSLLAAVIHNWSALKSTTPDGLRRGFLQRAGILRRHNHNWLLQAERETHDILLDQLPWSIRVVKLPWMSEILYVEW
ncbi:contractile injection system tape measure protein [Leptothoe spongobia]|uniref:Uncharacterized protein n=1 Tax=Leptothoe spongobia TAU-MAC 1115 TaxID=1967444 RepID=A0A947GGP2_9CYAN|nr:contractile injection system tape measure protein [Leptothoe spongobia]MBT9314469.1 hypothetical protein [Leptothoe spongobia TAU-MAC 1115]